MKRFTSDAIRNRMIERLRMNEDWALILQDGTIGNLIDTIAEGDAELARYEEYLLGEKKWKTAMNFSSLQHQSDLIGYKRRLPESAIGYVVVSHTDELGQNRLQNYGSYFFDLDAASDYDNFERDPEASLEETKALVPWIDSTPYIIPEGTRFISSNGIEFISTKTVTSRLLPEAWSTISADEDKLRQFYEVGGWNGIKYSKVPVIQGKKKHVSIGTTNATRFQAVTYLHTDIEDAANSISEKYFKLTLEYEGNIETWVEIDNIFRAGPYDKVFEKRVLKDGTGIMIKFGDGISGQLPPQGYTIYLDYLETLGKAGNIDAKYQMREMIFPDGLIPTDPRQEGTIAKFLDCTNTCAILGGKDIETQDEFKNNAPASYLKSYTIGTADLYLDRIMKYSPLSLLHCKVYPDRSITAKDTNGIKDNTIRDEFNIISSNLQITAVQANGDKIEADEADEAFIKPLLLSLSGQISPNDAFTYVEPNFIEFAPSIKVRTRSLSLNDNDAKDMISTLISNEYDIFNQEFNEPLYTSKIVDLASTFSWADSVEVTNEALANISFDSNDLIATTLKKGHDELLIAIPFKFDAIFLKNLYKAGLKDSSVKADYLLKVDLKFKNGKPSTLNRTFFYFDDRKSPDTPLLPIMDNKDTANSPYITIGNQNIYFNPEGRRSTIDDEYKSEEVRIAQFKYIDKITDTKYLANIKEAQEIRPYILDSKGKPRYVQSENESGLVNITNPDFINYMSIFISLSEKNTLSTSTAEGYVILPLDYFQFDANTINKSMYEDNPNSFAKVLEILLKEYVDIKVYAQPITEVFEPKNPNDICFIRKENIKVEKEIIY